MRKMSLLHWLLLPPALLLFLLSLGGTFLVLSYTPPVVAVVAWVALGVVVLWFVLARGKSAPGLNSETALIGRQTSKDGLL